MTGRYVWTNGCRSPVVNI